VEHLSVRPIGRQTNPVVDDASLTLHGGEVLGVAGLQGSGNSELLLAIFGALGARTSGRVFVDQTPIRIRNVRDAMAGGIALLTNDRKSTGLVLSMSVTANTTLADLPRLSPGGLRSDRRERDAAARHARAMNLRTPSLDTEVGSLSGGNQQKVALAKWLQREPHVLLLDEPTRGVDIGAKREIYGLINDLKRRGAAILLISTEMPELLGLCDRVVVMHRGAITARLDRNQATPETVLAAAMGQAMHPVPA
jgi:ABC-type sugar transport system ATPase subunit